MTRMYDMDCTECGAGPGRKCFGSCPSWKPVPVEGPSLRDQFAMAALTGRLANPLITTPADWDRAHVHNIAIDSFMVADAMMNARELTK